MLTKCCCLHDESALRETSLAEISPVVPKNRSRTTPNKVHPLRALRSRRSSRAQPSAPRSLRRTNGTFVWCSSGRRCGQIDGLPRAAFQINLPLHLGTPSTSGEPNVVGNNSSPLTFLNILLTPHKMWCIFLL